MMVTRAQSPIVPVDDKETKRYVVSRLSPMVGYGVAVLAVVVALLLTWFFEIELKRATFVFFLIAVIVSTWCGDFGPGLLAMVLATLGSAYFLLLPPYQDLRFGTPNDLAWLGVFVLVTTLMGSLTATRRRTEEALREAHRRLRLHLENTPLAVIEWDNAWRVRQWSRQAERVFGWTAEEVQGKHASDWRFFIDAEGADQLGSMTPSVANEWPRSESHLSSQTRNYTRDGRVLTCEWYNSSLLDDADTPVSILSLVHNITPRVQAEQALAQRTAEIQRVNEELRQFAYIVSHDLQEPLRMVTSYVQLLAKRYQGQLNIEADEFIHHALDGTQRMREFIQDLLAYSRVGNQEQKIGPTDCQAVLSGTLSNLRVATAESGAAITHDRLPTVLADRVQLGQLLQNLLGNALKFHGSEPLRVHLSARQEGSHWVFSVCDNGIGIEPQQAGRIFEVFQRLHTRQEYPGTGIGLAICKKIIERHGGRIWVESEPGKGATFFFTLPAA